MNNVESTRRLNSRELELGIAGTSASWHAQYANSPVVYIGGLRPNITDERILGVFEQYGVVEHLNIIRDEKTNEPRGFAFLAYADSRSAVLAVDNLNGAVLHDRTLRVDHVQDYKYPVGASGDSTEKNVKPAHIIVEMPQVPGFNATHSKSHDQNRESIVMARLKEMRRVRAMVERDAELEAKEDTSARKRKRTNQLVGTLREEKQLHAKAADAASPEHSEDKGEHLKRQKVLDKERGGLNEHIEYFAGSTSERRAMMERCPSCSTHCTVFAICSPSEMLSLTFATPLSQTVYVRSPCAASHHKLLSSPSIRRPRFTNSNGLAAARNDFIFQRKHVTAQLSNILIRPTSLLLTW
eukprot:IDg10697t1